MALRHALIVLAAGASVALGGAVAADASTTGPAPAASTPIDQCSAAYYQSNALLGPDQLPVIGPVGFQLAGYRRTGSLEESRFFSTYRNAAGWIYPPDNGYRIAPDGNPIEWTQTLAPDDVIDRYGSVYGSFLAPEGTPYSERAIPPSSLDGTPAAGCNYHEYEVVKPFTVDAGPIAAWFAQPGGGLQFQLDATLVPGAPAQLNVLWLLDNGYLKEVTPPA